ncbi:MAG: DUF2141 domain-containing protein [Planctomycetota bacterium]
MKIKTMFVVAILASAICGQWSLLPSAQGKFSVASAGLQLTVEVTEIKGRDGQLIVSVYDREAGFPNQLEKARATLKTLPTKPKVVFKNLTSGNYAVVVVHDRNKNNQIDQNFIGMPKEPVGLSNYNTIGLSNRPSFKKALISLKKSGGVKVKLISL